MFSKPLRGRQEWLFWSSKPLCERRAVTGVKPSKPPLGGGRLAGSLFGQSSVGGRRVSGSRRKVPIASGRKVAGFLFQWPKALILPSLCYPQILRSLAKRFLKPVYWPGSIRSKFHVFGPKQRPPKDFSDGVFPIDLG